MMTNTKKRLTVEEQIDILTKANIKIADEFRVDFYDYAKGITSTHCYSLINYSTEEFVSKFTCKVSLRAKSFYIWWTNVGDNRHRLLFLKGIKCSAIDGDRFIKIFFYTKKQIYDFIEIFKMTHEGKPLLDIRINHALIDFVFKKD